MSTSCHVLLVKPSRDAAAAAVPGTGTTAGASVADAEVRAPPVPAGPPATRLLTTPLAKRRMVAVPSARFTGAAMWGEWVLARSRRVKAMMIGFFPRLSTTSVEAQACCTGSPQQAVHCWSLKSSEKQQRNEIECDRASEIEHDGIGESRLSAFCCVGWQDRSGQL